MRRRTWLGQAGLAGIGATLACGDDTAPADAGSPMDAGVDGRGDAARDAGPDVGSDAGTDAEPTAVPAPEVPFGFGFGVASGDPLADAVVLWTRYRPETPSGELNVTWLIARDPELNDVAREGDFVTSADRDWTVKVDVHGLTSNTSYYYQFAVADERSPIGRTRTAGADVSELRLGVVSCSSYAHGYFHIYRALAEMPDLDAVLHLGDYIYEYGDLEYGDKRLYDPSHEITTLDDYRRRYQQYRIDPDCRALHQQHPLICTWDDHEIADNAWSEGAANHNEGEGEWATRKAAAYRAYVEWMPIREQEAHKIWRAFDWGELLQLTMLDTRVWGRDEQDVDVENPARTLLGDDQEAWFQERMESGATWQLIGQQVMLGHWDIATDGGGFTSLNSDQWDGYTAARSRFFDSMETATNPVVLTGDIHSHWAMELTRNPHDPALYNAATSEGSLGVEFVVSAVTSPGVGEPTSSALEMLALEDNPHLRHVNFDYRGFIVLDLAFERVQADFYVIDGVGAMEGALTHERSFQVLEGTRRLMDVDGPLPVRSGSPDFAPDPPLRDHLPER